MMVGGEDTNQETHQSNRDTIRWLAGFGLATNLHLVLTNLHSFWSMQPLPARISSLISDLTSLHRHLTKLRHQMTKILHHQTNLRILRTDEVLYDSCQPTEFQQISSPKVLRMPPNIRQWVLWRPNLPQCPPNFLKMSRVTIGPFTVAHPTHVWFAFVIQSWRPCFRVSLVVVFSLSTRSELAGGDWRRR
jgi:hypothetical protein